MNTILLIDDEIYARKGLLGLVPWNEYGYDIIGEAENGEEALQLIEEKQPDVVITDIRMPVLDGLGLIRTVQQRGLANPKFVIISGYGDFKYAQEAVRFGVQDFILKPIDEEELIQTLKRLSVLIDQSRTRLKAEAAMQPVVVFEGLLAGKFKERPAGDTAKLLRLPNRRRELNYFVVEYNNAHLSGTDTGTRINTWKRSISRTLERLDPAGEPFLYDHSPYAFGFIAVAGHLSGSYRSWEQLAEGLLISVSPDDRAFMRIYVGQPIRELEDMKHAFDTANETMNYKYALDQQNIIIYDTAIATALTYQELRADVYSNLMEHFEENNVPEVESIVSSIFDSFGRDHFAPESVIASISRCVLGITALIRTMEGNENDLKTLKCVLQWHKEAPQTHTGLKVIVLAFLQESAEYIAGLRKDQAKGGIHKVKQYIETHYQHNISLKILAKQFFINPVYLGQLFKKTYGVYFNEYLLDLRIHEAKRQLRQTDYKIYEISANIGFSNADYFVTQFEKVEKKTPTEYKNALHAKT